MPKAEFCLYGIPLDGISVKESQNFTQMQNTHLLWQSALLHPASLLDVSATFTAGCRRGDGRSAGPHPLPLPLFEKGRDELLGLKTSH